MAAQLAATDPDTTAFTAEVTAVDGTDLRLDRTYFYAASGGQPADRGWIAGVPVADVILVDGGTVHTLAEPADVSVGRTVEATIDEAFRTYSRRAHTASHVIYGAARGLLEALGYGGFDIGEEKVRIDFRTTTDVDDALLVELERRANRAVWESRPVTWEQVDPATLESRPGVAFNTKTEEGVFGTGEDVRIVEIGPASVGDDEDWWDRAACGGTHVRNTREIGPVAVLGRENPGEGLTRIELAVGPTAIEHRANLARAAHEAAAALGVGVADVPERVTDLQAELEACETERRAAEDRAIATQLAAVDPVARDGAEWLVASVEGADADALTRHARERVGDGTDVVVLVNETRPLQLAVAAAGEVDAQRVVEDVTDAFGGGGGGSPAFAQGGGIDAGATAVLETLGR